MNATSTFSQTKLRDRSQSIHESRYLILFGLANDGVSESRMSLVSGVPRLRGSKKSRTGCSTCKYVSDPMEARKMLMETYRVRHVKCDEVKPSCQRCSSTGRVCDGYSSPTRTSLSFEITLGPIRSKTESRYFDLFQRNTMICLMGFDHRSTFWRYMVLQFCQSSPAVLHAVLALAALHEHLDGKSNENGNAGSYRLSLMQYNKSIGYLRARQSRQATPLTLTCCVLFFCLENAQGDHDTALAHLQNGLKILQDWKMDTNTSASEDLAIENLTNVFRRLDMQATIFLDSRQPELNATSTLRSLQTDHSGPSCFSSMRDAQTSLEEIELRLFYVLTTKSTQHESSKSHADMLSKRAPLLHGLAGRFKEWKEAFDSFSNRASERLHTEDVRLGVLLALHYESTTLMLDIKTKQTPDMGDILTWESKITRINDLSKSLIKTSESRFAFSADTGVIAPLYYAAMRATSSPVRQQAIKILRSVKCREGFWDAETAARVAENVSQAKITGATGLPVNGSLPVLAKAHCVVTCH